MRYLFDSNVFLWSVSEPSKLNKAALALLRSKRSDVYLSSVTSWEVAIKYSIGRLRLPSPPRKFITQVLAEFGYASLEVQHIHAASVAELPHHHKDPFDRLLVAQARVEGMVLLTADQSLERYEVQFLRCGV